MSFHVGQRVACVDDDPRSSVLGMRNGNMGGLQRGQVYTVRGLGDCQGIAVLFLVEIERWLEPGFQRTRFRPLSETRLDQFRAHLAPKPVKHVEREGAVS